MVNELLTRGVVDCLVKEHLEERLQRGDKLRVKFGIDPTGSELHLGHAVVLRKLQAFQQAGHHIILLFGTFTGQIGDPTGRDQARKPLTEEQVAKNAETFLEQASRLLDIKNLEVVRNGDWLNKMTFKEVVELASSFTVQQMLHRDMYEKRIAEEKEIALHEFLYPLMQGYDSVPIRADLELGGTDQLFNLMAGRVIQKKYGQSPQDIMTLPILVGLDGKEKMSKSFGNYIGLRESPREMFGKTMSIPDDLMANWFELLTAVPETEIQEILKGHPRDAKLRLASEIVSEFHSAAAALSAQEEFLRVFSGEKGVPSEMPEIALAKGAHSALDIVVASALCESNSDARRMLEQNAVKIDGKKVAMTEMIEIDEEGRVLQVGKHKFARIMGK